MYYNIMECPNDKEYLERCLFHEVEVDYCPKCLGIWFDKDELKLAKNDKDKNLNWLDVDLWRDKGRFKVMRVNKFCPVCRAGLVEINYDESKTKVDYCKMCQGVWLDRGEFKQIINYLKNKSDYEILNHYTKNLVLELWEVFSGPETFREELEDFLTLLKLFNYKFITQHSHLEGLINDLPK
jgi:Zn-finger nucleic acid-binding protein